MKRPPLFVAPVATGCTAAAIDASAPDGGASTPTSSDGGAAQDAPGPSATDGGTPTCPSPLVVATCSGGYCSVPAGCFVMGSPVGEPCRTSIPDLNEETAHEVTLTHAFEIGEKEVTRAEFQALMGYDPSAQKACGDDCPVDGVPWDEAAAYCSALATSKGLEPCYACKGTGKDVDCTGSPSRRSAPWAR